MHEPLLARAVLPARPRICGRFLNPFSLGHYLYLVRENSPFVIGGKIQPGDVFEAVWICCNDWESLRTALDSYLYLFHLYFLRRAARKSNHDLNVEALNNYFEEGKLVLPVSDNVRPDRVGGGREAGAPFILRLHHFLMTVYRMGYVQAWDLPLGEAIMRWQTHWEIEGGADIFNSYDAECDPATAEAEIEARIAAEKEKETAWQQES